MPDIRQAESSRADNVWWILHPQKAPAKGLFSFPNAQTLDEGEFSAMAGLRLDRRVVRVKDGDVKLTSAAILASATFRGAGTFRNGMVSSANPTIFAGFHLSNFGRVFTSTTGTAFATELSASSGEFADTRFTTSTSHDPWFYYQAVTNRFIPDSSYGVLGDTCFLVAHHGNAPRLYSSLYNVYGIHDEISTPQVGTTLTPIATFPAYLLVNTTAETTHSQVTGTTLTFTDRGTTPNNYIRLQAVNPVLNDRARIDFGTAMSLGTAGGALTSRQLVMLLASPTVNILDKYTIYVGNSGGTVAIYDPTSSTKNQAPTITPADASGKLFWVGFSLETIDGTTTPALNSIDYIDFLWAQASETATYNLYIFAICGSGKDPGGAFHALTYGRRKMMCESRPFFYPAAKPALISSLGGATAISTYIPPGMRIPCLDSRILVNYTVPYQNVTQAELNKGTDMAILYRMDPGEKWYSWVTTDTIGTFLGTWSFSSGSALGIRTITDNYPDKNIAFRAPTPDTYPIPACKAMCFANNRLYAATRPSSSLGYSTLNISDENFPGRMRDAARTLTGPTDFDPTSGTTHQFEDEDIMQIVSTPGQYQGVSMVYVFTNKSIWAIGRDVNRAERMASIGTMSPMSVVEHEGRIFFLDADRRLQMIVDGQIRDISTGVVQDILESIPGGSDAGVSRLYRVSGACWKNYYRLSYGTSGSTNTKVLVYDILRDMFVSNETMTLSGFTVEQFITWESAGIVGLYAFSSDREFYQYEQPASTANADITLTTGEHRYEEWQSFFLNRIGFVTDDVAASVTTSRSFYPGTATPTTATCSLNVATDRAWKYDAAQSTTGDKVGRTAKVSITGTLPGGTNLYEIMAECESVEPGASR